MLRILICLLFTSILHYANAQSEEDEAEFEIYKEVPFDPSCLSHQRHSGITKVTV